MERPGFVVDESSWILQGVEPVVFLQALDLFADRLEQVQQRPQEVHIWSEFYEWQVTESLQMHDLLFGKQAPLDGREEPLRRRLMRLLDQCDTWELEEDTIYVHLNGIKTYAPSIAWAHHRWTQALPTGVLALRSIGRSGTLEVLREQHGVMLGFIVTDSDRITFYRHVLNSFPCNPDYIGSLLIDAFPRLGWVDGAWEEHHRFTQPFHEMKPLVMRHLEVLNDCALSIFAGYPDARDRASRLSAEGCPASDEDGKTKQNSDCRRERSRLFEGLERTFWWHSKLQPHQNRIHFEVDVEGGRVVIGLLCDHCSIPGN